MPNPPSSVAGTPTAGAMPGSQHDANMSTVDAVSVAAHRA